MASPEIISDDDKPTKALSWNSWYLKVAMKNIIPIIIVLFVVYTQFPVVKKNFETQGSMLKQHEYQELVSNKLTVFPPKDGNAVAIFWATWCGPCKIEMDRLKKSVEAGKIPRNRIFAINSFETTVEIKKFLKENNYPFLFIEAGEIGNQLKVDRTPTTIFVKNGKITSMSSGMSFIGIWRAESLF